MSELIENIESDQGNQLAPEGSYEDKAAVITQYAIYIDNACAQILGRICRFSMEYELREKQALAYSAANYTGTVPRQVNAFALPAGIPAKDATIIILAQATAYREALDELSELRMRKFALEGLDAEAAHAEYSDIMAEIDTLNRGLI